MDMMIMPPQHGKQELGTLHSPLSRIHFEPTNHYQEQIYQGQGYFCIPYGSEEPVCSYIQCSYLSWHIQGTMFSDTDEGVLWGLLPKAPPRNLTSPH